MTDGELAKRVTALERESEQIRFTVYGARGDNGLYGGLKDADGRMGRIEDRLDGIYKMLAVFALSFITSAVGVIITLVLTSHG